MRIRPGSDNCSRDRPPAPVTFGSGNGIAGGIARNTGRSGCWKIPGRTGGSWVWVVEFKLLFRGLAASFFSGLCDSSENISRSGTGRSRAVSSGAGGGKEPGVCGGDGRGGGEAGTEIIRFGETGRFRRR